MVTVVRFEAEGTDGVEQRGAVRPSRCGLTPHPGLAEAIEEVVQVLSVPVKLRQDCLGVCDGRITPL
jgi:hypothetical protein